MWKALACGCVVLMLALSASAQTAPPLFEEDFADASVWRFPPGAFKAENGALVCSSPNAAVAALADRTFADLTLDLDLFRPPKGLVGVSIRRQKGPDAWADAYYFVSQQPRHLRVIRKVGGRYDSALFESDRLKELPANATAHLRIWAKGDHFRVWIGGNLIANVRDEYPFLSGGIALHVGTGGIEPPARFGKLTVLGADAVAPPKPDEIPPLGLAETLERSQTALKTEVQEIKPRLAEAAQTGEADDDAALQRKVELVHALLWRYYLDPRTNMVYTILEPHTGQVVFPTREQVLSNFPNANGWSTAIEDCAGYGLGRHLAWLVERYELTHKPEHAADARRVLEGALLLGMIRPADASGFGELVRGVLPDGQTYYKGEGPGSSGDNYNGYSYGLWRYSRARFASKEEHRRIAAALDRTCYRPYSFPAFAAIAADVTGNDRWREQYAAARKSFARNAAGWTAASRLEAKSWTAVQLQLQLTALLGIETDPQIRAVCEHARRANAWSRWKEMLAGLTYDERKDDYTHRVETVRNPLDGMLTVMLSGDREIIGAFLPVFRRVVARYDFTAFRDQRQLTPYLGVYWLGVRQAVLTYDPALPPPPAEAVRLKPLESNRQLVVTYFPEHNPKPPR